jgi:hypothetical protein
MCAAVPMVAAPQVAASAFHASVPAMRIAAVAASAIMSFRIASSLGWVRRPLQHGEGKSGSGNIQSRKLCVGSGSGLRS